jgi:hypothetical protein
VSARIARIEAEMLNSPAGIKFTDLKAVCDHYFGAPRNQGTSHHVYRMPWAGNPRINIQKKGSKAKECQVKQALVAIAKLKEGTY